MIGLNLIVLTQNMSMINRQIVLFRLSYTISYNASVSTDSVDSLFLSRSQQMYSYASEDYMAILCSDLLESFDYIIGFRSLGHSVEVQTPAFDIVYCWSVSLSLLVYQYKWSEMLLVILPINVSQSSVWSSVISPNTNRIITCMFQSHITNHQSSVASNWLKATKC